MKKILSALITIFVCIESVGVFAYAETPAPEDGISVVQKDEEFILPDAEELIIAEPDTEESTIQLIPAETKVIVKTEPSPLVSSTKSTAETMPQNDSGELRIAFDGVVSETVIPILLDGVTYVPFRAFCINAVDEAEIFWDSDTFTSVCVSDNIEITAPYDENYIIANGRVLFRDEENISVGSTLYVPVRSLSVAIGAQVQWLESEMCVNLITSGEPILSAEQFYNKDDLLWLARIISAESKYEPMLGKIAVGNVVMNRVANSSFPDTVYDVIFDCRYSIQFYPVTSPVIYNKPTDESIIAAKACLEGYSISTEILYFMNPTLTLSSWMSRNCDLILVIGNHSFYA